MLGAGEQARPPKRPVLLTEQTNRCRRGGFQNSDWQPRQSHLSDEGLSPLSYRGKNSVPPRALTGGEKCFQSVPMPPFSHAFGAYMGSYLPEQHSLSPAGSRTFPVRPNSSSLPQLQSGTSTPPGAVARRPLRPCQAEPTGLRRPSAPPHLAFHARSRLPLGPPGGDEIVQCVELDEKRVVAVRG